MNKDITSHLMEDFERELTEQTNRITRILLWMVGGSTLFLVFLLLIF